MYIFNYNQSSMILDKNGRASIREETRHINYFFILDSLKYGEVTIKYCLAYDTIWDYFTKPLNGAKFRKFKGEILNIQVSNDGQVTASGTSQLDFWGV